MAHCVSTEDCAKAQKARIRKGFPVVAKLTRGERLQIMLTEEEVEALDNWRFSRRMPSRASAVRELLKRGLAAEGFMAAEQGQKSEDFGVTGRSPNQKTDDAADASVAAKAKK